MSQILFVLYTLMALICVLCVVSILKAYTSKDENGVRHFIKASRYLELLSIVSAIATLAAIFNAAVNILKFYQKVSGANEQDPTWQVAAAFACIAFGGLAYTARCRARLLYGVVEVSIGVVAAYRATGSYDTSTLLQIAAGIYIIVRGMDNIEKALKKRPELRETWIQIFGRPD